MKHTAHRSLSVDLETCPDGYRWRFTAMGTQWEIVVTETDHDDAVVLLQHSVQWACGFEARYSRYRPDSLISHINQRAGSGEWTELNRADRYVFERAAEAVFTTGGLVDPSALPLCRLWDFRREDPTPPTTAQIGQALNLVGWHHVQLDHRGVHLPHAGMGLDVGGFGKELAVDQLGQLLAAHGVPAGLVNGGGDVIAWGAPPEKPAWHIALEDPTGGPLQRGFALTSGAIASSGHHQRFFKYQDHHYSHLIDPRDGQPSQSTVRAASVHAPSCFQAGLYATTACLLSPEEALERIGSAPLVEACLFTASGVRSTGGFDRQATSKRIAS